MTKIKFSNIDWDTSDDDHDVAPDPDVIGLPSHCVMELDDDAMADFPNLAEYMNQCGADLLSDHYGFCVFSYEWEQVEADQILKSFIQQHVTNRYSDEVEALVRAAFELGRTVGN